ncbi:MAG: biotin--[acetyl-CoA-carboxylase] ligase [Tannerella sp.]|jgi:BirA family biotin operon repressor/biotin-[acetyl-CoA-carboxylase] ligase|nr:biotin--[acetyl-CoA-carboxylase] ligase [Tannerella sp.]
MGTADFEYPPVIYLEKTDSTNREMRMRAEAGELMNESVVMAEFQTAGRGQSGSRWESEAGQNLTCSLLYCPVSLPVAQSFVLAELAALSVKHILDRHAGAVTVKWPNDLYRESGKIGGLLIENLIDGNRITRSIIGIGLNLNQKIFCSDAPNPVSLSRITGLAYDPKEMLRTLRVAFHQLAGRLESDGQERIHREYVEAQYRNDGCFYLWEDAGGRFEARFRDIAPSGHLLLERRDGAVSRYAFKEVRYV